MTGSFNGVALRNTRKPPARLGLRRSGDAGVAAHVGAVAAGQQHAVFGRGDDARRARSVVSSTISGSARNGSIRCGCRVGSALSASDSIAGAGRDADGVGRRCPPAAGRSAQARTGRRSCPGTGAGRGRSGAGCGSRRGSCPTARASARALEEHAGDGPQGVAALDDIVSGRVGRELATAARRPAPPAARWRAASGVIGKFCAAAGAREASAASTRQRGQKAGRKPAP